MATLEINKGGTTVILENVPDSEVSTLIQNGVLTPKGRRKVDEQIFTASGAERVQNKAPLSDVQNSGFLGMLASGANFAGKAVGQAVSGGIQGLQNLAGGVQESVRPQRMIEDLGLEPETPINRLIQAADQLKIPTPEPSGDMSVLHPWIPIPRAAFSEGNLLRSVNRASEFMTSGLPFAGFGGTAAVRAAESVPRRIFGATSLPVTSATGGAAMATAEEILPESRGAQTAAGLLGALAPGGLVTAGRIISPKAAETVRDTISRQFGASLRNRPNARITRPRSLEEAGEFIQDTTDAFIRSEKQQVIQPAYNRLYNVVRRDTMGDTRETNRLLRAIQDKAQAGRIPDPLRGLVGQIEDTLDAAMMSGRQNLTLQELRNIRQAVGKKLNRSDDVPQISQLYNAVRQDMRNLVKNQGGDEALELFKEADKLHGSLETLRANVIKKIVSKTGDPTETFKKASRASLKKLEGLFRTARTAEEKDIMASVLLENMGRSSIDDAFDLDLFARRWSNPDRMTRRVRDLIVDNIGTPNFRSDLETALSINALTSNNPEMIEQTMATIAEVGGARPLIRGGGGQHGVNPIQFFAMLKNPVAAQVVLENLGTSTALAISRPAPALLAERTAQQGGPEGVIASR